MDINTTDQQPGQSRKKCHGNRRDQRFRRQCRKKQMKPNKIEKLLKKRNRHRPQIIRSTNQGGTDRNTSVLEATTTATTTMRNVNKRKRDISIQNFQTFPTTTTMLPTSTSSTSITTQSVPLKKQKTTTMINNNTHMNYRRPMFLKRSPTILFQMLKTPFNDTIKMKIEKEFIYTRIQLMDQQYCLEVHQQLWKTYFDLGIEKQQWPDQLQQMAKSSDLNYCRQYLVNILEAIQTELNKFQIELNTQKQSCPIVNVSIDQIDQYLKKFILCQRQYLSIRNNNEIKKFKEHLTASHSFQSISIQHGFTSVQNEFLQKLISIRQQEMKIREELLQFEMHISCNFLPINFHQMETFIVPLSYSPIIKQQNIIQFNHKHYKIIQEGKREWLDILLHTYEMKLQQYEQQYEHIFRQLSNNNTTTVNNEMIIMNKIQEYVDYHTNKLKQDMSEKMSFFRRKLLKTRQHSSTAKTTVGVAPEPYLDLDKNPFNACQWNQLSLGPSFIRLNQSANRPQKQQKIEIEKQYKDITQKVKKHVTSEPHFVSLTSPYMKQYERDLHLYLHDSYLSHIPYQNQIQSLQQLHIATSIRKTIQQNNLILRVTDKGHNFYIGSAKEFEDKVQTFFQDTKAFEPLSENPFHQIKDKAIALLNQLREKGSISKKQYEEMAPDPKQTELAHLYFKPKTHKDGIPVRPIESTIHASTRNISKFLDKIIRPIFNEKCHQTNITDSYSFLNKILEYTTKKDHFKSSTLFCTFDIRNLYTMLPQDEALNTLVEFLYAYGCRNVQGIPLDTIRKLASFVIKENVFAYDKKVYRQVHGGAMGSSFTLTLANIYMWKWQQKFVREQDSTGELFLRYIDDVFITWNKSEQDLINLLEQANKWDSNIKLDYKIGKSLPFLDILLTNDNGILSTSVYHKPSAEPYVAPFTSDHPRHIFVNILQNSLKHALIHSSTFEAFNHERRYIKLMLLYNGYPSSFIESQFRKFFQEHISSTSLLSFLTDEQQFHTIRQKFLKQPTDHQTPNEFTTTTGPNPNLSTNAAQQTTITTSNNGQNNEDDKTNRKFYIHPPNEHRFRNMKRGLHQVHQDLFNQSLAKNVKMTVGNRNRRNAANELIRKKPPKSLLLNKPRQRKHPRTSRITTDQVK